MNEKKVTLEQKGRAAVITFNDPRTLNALTPDLIRELGGILTQIENDDQTGVVIITGSGKAFAAGADIAYMRDMKPREAAVYSKVTTDLYRRMEAMNKIFIAAVNGYALGGGCELALACDLRIASQSAKFGLPEVSLGIVPGGGGTQRLPRLIGSTRAKYLIYTGSIISAAEAERIGLVNELAEPENLEQAAVKMAENILKNSLTAVRYSKEAINCGRDIDMENAITLEKELFALCFADPDQKEGMSAFIEKRKPEFERRRQSPPI